MTRRDMGMQTPEILNSATASAEFTPTDEQIRYRAYEIYAARRHNGVYGNAMADWTAAECELQTRRDVDRQTSLIGD